MLTTELFDRFLNLLDEKDHLPETFTSGRDLSIFRTLNLSPSDKVIIQKHVELPLLNGKIERIIIHQVIQKQFQIDSDAHLCSKFEFRDCSFNNLEIVGHADVTLSNCYSDPKKNSFTISL